MTDLAMKFKAYLKEMRSHDIDCVMNKQHLLAKQLCLIRIKRFSVAMETNLI